MDYPVIHRPGYPPWTPVFGRDKTILREREKIKKQTIRQRRLQHQKQAA